MDWQDELHKLLLCRGWRLEITHKKLRFGAILTNPFDERYIGEAHEINDAIKDALRATREDGPA